jgi:hypothetical protein
MKERVDEIEFSKYFQWQDAQQELDAARQVRANSHGLVKSPSDELLANLESKVEELKVSYEAYSVWRSDEAA